MKTETGFGDGHADNRIKRRFDPSKQIAAGEVATASIRFQGNCTEAIEIIGAGDRDRTDDIQLGKLTFYH